MYGFNDCTVVEFGKGCFHVYGKDGVFGIVVEQGLREFVEFFSAARAADGELVVADGGGDGGGDLFGDCGGNNAAKYDSASNGSDFAVWFEEGNDTGRSESVEGGWGGL